MLARLNVRQKLRLLVVLPFAAVLLTGVPLAAWQISDAVSAGSTVAVAEQARAVAVLVQDLQQERLLSLAHLASQDASDASLVSGIATTTDDRSHVARTLVLPRDETLRAVVTGLQTLDGLRTSVVRRAVGPATVYRTYHDAVVGLLDALRLTRAERVDASDISQMHALDALLRTSEESGRVGAALVFASINAASASAAIPLVAEAQLLHGADVARFRQQAGREDNALLDLVERGPAAQRVDALVNQLNRASGPLPLADSLSAAQTTISLAQIQQERIARDVAMRAEARASTARSTTILIVVAVVALIGFVNLLSAAVGRSVARPLRRLTEAAVQVAEIGAAELVRVADSETEDSRPPRLPPVEVQTRDEIGDLAEAFNRVQTTAARLMEQQLATRRNTAIMFANIARRTRGMVSRQLTFIDDLERNEQNERLLSRLYRLDHLTTRLLRSADSLLVVSGAREEDRIVAPAPLAEVLRSAIAEIEGYQNVRVGQVVEAIVAPQLASDLRLVLAELLENATAFSPPGSPVEVETIFDASTTQTPGAPGPGTCLVRIVDRGIGLSAERLAEENRRLVERERLDVVPTSVLGLFVVGRIARRHGLRVELSRTSGHGVTAMVAVPNHLLSPSSAVLARPEPAAVAPGARSAATVTAREVPSAAPGAGMPSGVAVPAAPPTVLPAPPTVLPAPPTVLPAPPPAPPAAAPAPSAAAPATPLPVPGFPVLPSPPTAPPPVPAKADEPTVFVRDEPTVVVRDEPLAEVRDEPLAEVRDEPLAEVRDEPTVVVPISAPPIPERPRSNRSVLEWWWASGRTFTPDGPGMQLAPRPSEPSAGSQETQALRLPAAEAESAEDVTSVLGVAGAGAPEDVTSVLGVAGAGAPEDVTSVLAVSEAAAAEEVTSVFAVPAEGARDPGSPVGVASQPPPVGAGDAVEAIDRGLSGFNRRRPGGHLPSFALNDDDDKTHPVNRDADLERAALDSLGSREATAVEARAVEQPVVVTSAVETPAIGTAAVSAPAPIPTPDPSPSRGGLVRRRPGDHLSDDLRSSLEPRSATAADPATGASGVPIRDPEAERAALDSFLDGLARASAASDQHPRR